MGFTTGSYQVPDEETIQTLLTKVDYTQIQYDEASGNVTIPEGMTIDLGSIAQGLCQVNLQPGHCATKVSLPRF